MQRTNLTLHLSVSAFNYVVVSFEKYLFRQPLGRERPLQINRQYRSRPTKIRVFSVFPERKSVLNYA